MPAFPAENPPLRQGERLARADFERRFDVTPNLKMAELIDGEVFSHPPQSFTKHAGPRALLLGLLGRYTFSTPAVHAGAHAHIRIDESNEFQPSGVLLIDPSYGGTVYIPIRTAFSLDRLNLLSKCSNRPRGNSGRRSGRSTVSSV